MAAVENPENPRKSLPIGVFDSGVGGLTVVRALRKRLPKEAILYFGDTARVPYGTKSSDTIRRYTREISSFLNNQGVKMIVAACNSCSATALDCVQDCFGGPVLGVIEPGAKKAVSLTRNKKIGVIGTRATVGSGAYESQVKRLLPDAQVFSTACPLFVPLAEERMQDHPAARLIAKDYLEPLLAQEIDTLILGCTHYPLLANTIREVAGEGIEVIDSAETTAEFARDRLKEGGLLSDRDESVPLHVFASDDSQGMEKFCGLLLPEETVWVGTIHPDGALEESVR